MNALFDDMYMKKHIGEYILFQLEQGYDIKDIKGALSRHGYKKKIVDDILKQVQVSASPKKKQKMYSHTDLDNELKIYVQSLLIDYIIKEHKLGYTLEAIRNALINYGHDAKAVDEAIVIIEKGKVVDYKMPSSATKFPQQIAGSVTLFFIFAFLVFLSVATNTSIISIIPNFLPAFVTFILMNIIYYFMPNTKILTALPLLAVMMCVGLFIAGVQYAIIGKAPGSDIILILNAAVAFISSGIVCAFSKKEKEDVLVKVKKRPNQSEEVLVEQKIQKPTLTEQIPKEPYHPHGKQIIPHHNSMLHYLKEGIDKPAEKKEQPLQQQTTPAPHVAHRPAHQQHASRSHVKIQRQMPALVGTLPEKKEKKARIPLKSME